MAIRQRQKSGVRGTIEQMESRLLLTSIQMLGDSNDIVESYGVQHVEQLDGDIYFSYSNSSEIWKLEDGDGSPQFVTELQPWNDTDLGYLTRLNDRLLVGIQGNEWFELLALQPSTGDRELLLSGDVGGSTFDFVQYDDVVTFRYTDWHSPDPDYVITDGTLGGTHRLSSREFASIDEVAKTDRGIFFVCQRADVGSELWFAGHGEQQINLVRDIAPSELSSSPAELTVFGDQLLFTAETADGRELWQSDGTESGTLQVADLNPGPDSSDPTSFVVTEDMMYFMANTATGEQLWSLDSRTNVLFLQRRA